MHGTLEEWNEIRTGLTDYEMIHVEKLCYSPQWGLALRIGGMGPWTESCVQCRCPRDNSTGYVFAFESDVFPK